MCQHNVGIYSCTQWGLLLTKQSSKLDVREVSDLLWYLVLYGTCPWHVARVLTLSVLVLERLNRLGPKKNFVRPWPTTVIFSMARGTCFHEFTLCSQTADPILTRPTAFDRGKCWERDCVDAWMLTKSSNFTKLPLEPTLVARSGRRKRHLIRLWHKLVKNPNDRNCWFSG